MKKGKETRKMGWVIVLLGIALVIALIILIVNTAQARPGGPTQNPPTGNLSPFVNSGPEEQIIDGKLGIGTGNPTFDLEIGGPAELAGGLSVRNTNNAQAIISHGDVRVGAGGASTFELFGDMNVSGNFQSDTLSHNGTNQNEAVCVTNQGLLELCGPGGVNNN